ncbi:MAG: alpha/beta hydrolase-fold protein [Verrucomicrobiales bacterium]|nr:alpha/beta hydrolase-fold protein [Verrucomicrobiales bacterium]
MKLSAPSFFVALAFLTGSPLAAQTKAKKKTPPFSWVNSIENLDSRKDLPKGLQHGTFQSPSMKVEVGYFIYLPPAYESQPDRRLPVVFHLHGGRPGSEKKSIKLASYVAKAIETGKIQPTIYVFPNGGPMSWYNYPQIDHGQGEDVFVKELIPHIQETYRTRELAIEGFSQGGRGTTRIMFQHPELFVSAAPGGSGYEPEKRIQENNGAESERVVFAPGYNAWDLADKYGKREDKDKLPILLWVGTKGFNYEFNLKFSEHLKTLEIPHEMLIVEGVAHSASGIYEKRGLELMKFHQQSFAAPAE